MAQGVVPMFARAQALDAGQACPAACPLELAAALAPHKAAP